MEANYPELNFITGGSSGIGLATPLEPALEGVDIKIFDHFYNDSLTGSITKAEFTLTGPGITLRVADLFIVNEEGEITEQENHFDASPLRG